MNKILLFRADGDNKTGLGHLYRLFALVEMLKEDYRFVFITKESSVVSVIPLSYTIQIIPEEIDYSQEACWLANQFEANKSIVIADGYNFNGEYQKNIKREGFDLVYIDDLVKEHMYADCVINHSPEIEVSEYTKEDYTKLFLGTKFALLRPSFIQTAKIQKQKDLTMSNVFVCFGGADPLNLTQKVLNLLVKVQQVNQVNVLIGAANNRDYHIQSSNKEVNFYQNLNECELLELMQSCNCAIAPSSTILYELCCVKVPILSGYFVDNQIQIYNGFVKGQAIFGIGDFKAYSENELLIKFQDFFLGKRNKAMIEQQSRLFDGDISKRFNDLISDLC